MSKRIKIEGQKFGKLTVLKHIKDDKYLCKCDCGNEKVARSSRLRQGVTTSCGCDFSDKMSKIRHNDLTGKRYGKLTVESLDHKDGYTYYWKCKCDCGNYAVITASNLQSGRYNSCGCAKSDPSRFIGEKYGEWEVIGDLIQEGKRRYLPCRCSCGEERNVNYESLRKGKSKSSGCKNGRKGNFIDLTQQRFGNLTALRYAGNENKKTLWLCRCDCSNEVVVSSDKLRSGSATSCGCLTPDKSILGKRFGKLTVISTDGEETYKSQYLCKCDCGGEKIVYRNYLLSGLVRSCGCLPRGKRLPIDITGQKFGKLTAIKYVGDSKWLFKCDCGNDYIGDAYKVKTGHTSSCGCLSAATAGSKGENEVKAYVENFCEVETHDRNILDGKEIDILIPAKNIGIEYNGSYYHANKGGVRDLDVNYHRDKFLAAKEKGIHLIQIFDVDWERNQDKIKMYLKSVLTDQKKIFARKCELKKIDRDMADGFIDKYHIQGRSNTGRIAYGLFYENDLTSVMTFDKLRMSRTAPRHYELHRYCVKDGFTVLGGAERLFKTFLREYQPEYIRSYSDNDFFLGGIYERLKFKEVAQSTPRYYWMLEGVMLKREQCMLKRLKQAYPELLQEAYDVGASNKEDYVMLALGAMKVYHSGNTKWEWVKC